jgi:DNA-3-methyladenine glycosylase I
MTIRCAWCGSDPLYVAYHDEEWGVPPHDDRALFEMLCLEGAQAGLSWVTILRKRPHYRRVFRDFEPRAVARLKERDVALLLLDPGIVRNRLKIEAVIRNAKGVLAIQQQHGSLDTFLWRYVEHRPIQNAWRSMRELPASTDLSDQMGRDLKKLGFNFVGSTICYAFMQAVGMVNDHTVDCFRHAELSASSQAIEGNAPSIGPPGAREPK